MPRKGPIYARFVAQNIIQTGEFSTLLCHSDTAYVPTRHIDAPARKARPARDSAHEADTRVPRGSSRDYGPMLVAIQSDEIVEQDIQFWEISGRLRDRVTPDYSVGFRVSDAGRHRGPHDSPRRIRN